ncbi:MAG: ATP-dependent DNA helicase RecG [Candidatus Chisholmbacteria bacterium]|nr:ATP-dependent DNA helicase RecG [Candidatus Chisholmbacteria bacterium]
MVTNRLTFEDLEKPVASLPLIGPATAKRLEKINIFTIADLLLHPPHRYHDFSHIVTIATAKVGDTVTIQGEITKSLMLPTRSRVTLQKFTFTDTTGSIDITYFNQPYLLSTLRRGTEVSLAGVIESHRGKVGLVSPEYEIIKPNQPLLHTGRLIPQYPETKGVSSKWLRSRLAPLLSLLPSIDPLPETLRQKHELIPWKEALSSLHYPQNESQALKARARLAFDELIFLHLKSLLLKKRWQRRPATTALPLTDTEVSLFVKSLPFTLTSAQHRVIEEIRHDLSRVIPMNRLLEGDVGSGKTVIAAFSLFAALRHQKLGVIMAPTQILAHQHAQTLKEILKPFGARIASVTSGSKLKVYPERSRRANILVGTHALLHRQLLLQRAAVTIVDEQHRFGVAQRAALKNLKSTPHQLTMTATPIPRTVALTLYGNLDLSFLDESPPGKRLPKTWVVPRFKRPNAYHWIEDRVLKHHDQVFIVCPLIESSTKESMLQIKAATAEFQNLKKIFPQLSLDLLHGRLKAKEKTAIIHRFSRGLTHILVTTPVVEVGLDIPAASIMLIEAAERFGLASLHQLRGRIGRRNQDSFCLLFPSDSAPPTTHRLKLLETETSGMKLAEADLKLRGPGELYGTSQSGFFSLKIAALSNTPLIKLTKTAAEKLLHHSPSLTKYPLLKQKLNVLLDQAVVPN